jgi:hypothetical protein
MHFYLSRPLKNSIIIETDSLEEFKDYALCYAEFSDKDLEDCFSKRNRLQYQSSDDKLYYIMRLSKAQLKVMRTKVCPLCVEDDCTHYIEDDAQMCDQHTLAKFDLYQHITYDTADCMGMTELLPADEVIKVLRKITCAKK